MGDDWQLRTLGPDPLALPPRAGVAPNVNPASGSVGPNVPVAGDASAQEGLAGGYGASHVMYPADTPPPQAVAWAGWPVGWDVPDSTTLAGSYGIGTDVVWACVDLNARVTADMPVYVTQNLQLQPSPPWVLNPEPKVYTHFGEFWKQLFWSYQGSGEAFVVCTSRYQDSGYPRTFMCVPPWLVNAEIVGGQRRYSIGGTEATDDVLHIRYTSIQGDAHGHGPLECAGERLLAVKTLMRYGSDLARNGGIPWAVLKHKYRLTRDQAEALKLQWISAARSRMGAPAILDNDMGLEVLQVPPKDMALAEQQQHSESRIAVLLGVPPFLVGLPTGADSMTYASVNALFDYHHRITLRPMSRDIMRAMSGWLLPARTDVELNPDSYVRPDPGQRAAYYEVMTRIGAMTVEEVRMSERLAPLADSPAPAVPEATTGTEFADAGV